MLTPIFAAIFDGSLLTIITHPFAVMALAYGIPLAAIYVLAKVLGLNVAALYVPPLQWLGTPDPSVASQIEAAVIEALTKKPPTPPAA